MVTFNQSNAVLFVWLCYSKLQSHLVLQASPLLHKEGRVWSTEYTTAVPASTMDTAAQSEESIQSCDTLPPSTPI